MKTSYVALGASLLRNLCRAATALALTSLLPFTPAKAEYVLTELTMPGATSVTLWDVNNVGTMVGSSTQGTGPGNYSQGFIYDGTSFTTLSGPAGSISNSALGISDTGIVVGSFYSSATTDPGTGEVTFGPSVGFVYSGGSYTAFSIAGANDTFLRGISADGRYWSGYYSTAAVAGIGFVYDSLIGTLHNLSAPNSVSTIAQGINGAGIVVGSDILTGSPITRPGFRYDIATGTRTDESIPGADRTALRSIDDAGRVAGWFRDTGQLTHGFVGSVTSYEQIDFTGADSTFVEGSNNAGVLVGNFTLVPGESNHAFIATPVDDPAVLLSELASDVVGVGSGKSLANKMALAEAYYDANDIPATCAVLADFVREVAAQAGKKLTATQAATLTSDASSIMAAIGCD